MHTVSDCVVTTQMKQVSICKVSKKVGNFHKKGQEPRTHTTLIGTGEIGTVGGFPTEVSPAFTCKLLPFP